MNPTSISLLAAALFVTLTLGTAEAGRASRLLNNDAANKAVINSYQFGGKRLQIRRAPRRRVGRKPDVIILDEPPIFWPVVPIR